MSEDMSRRYFIRSGLLVLAAAITPGAIVLLNVSPGTAGPLPSFRPHAFVEIDADGSVTVWVGQTDLGQGTHTGIAMIAADELDADWERVRTRMALAAEPFKDPEWGIQATGGSTSIRHRWDMLRKAGAAARLMLLRAAAEQWGLDPATCTTRAGKVFHPDGRSVGYGDVAAKAAKLQVPLDPLLKNPDDYVFIGTLKRRLDMEDKVQGRTAFGIDTRLPGMCVAVLAHPPRFGAKPLAFDADGARKIRGVLDIVPLDNAVAVCAETTWAAMQGRDALKVTWSEGDRPDLNDEAITAELQAKLDGSAAVAENTGDAAKTLSEAATIVESVYSVPYVAHAQLEPTNCTAHVEKDRCRVWAPTQGQTSAQSEAARICGLPPEKVEVMTTPCGGGFGRRGETEVVTEAVSLSRAMNRPVKVVWTRDDEFAHDFFRPASICRISGGLDEGGNLVAWRRPSCPACGPRPSGTASIRPPSKAFRACPTPSPTVASNTPSPTCPYPWAGCAPWGIPTTASPWSPSWTNSPTWRARIPWRSVWVSWTRAPALTAPCPCWPTRPNGAAPCPKAGPGAWP
jgi:isoquinoline 1-oxidoreductase beta subunit